MSIICNPLFLYVYNMYLILSLFVSSVPYTFLILIRRTILFLVLSEQYSFFMCIMCTIQFLSLLCVYALSLCELCVPYTFFICFMCTVPFLYAYYVYLTLSQCALYVPSPFSKISLSSEQ